MKAPAFVLNLFGGDLAQLPSQLQPMLQAGYLETKFESFIEPMIGYTAGSDIVQFTEYEEHRGVTITKTRPGLKAPIQVATDPALAQGPGSTFDNGITPADVSIEQYTLAPGTYQDGMNLDLIGTNFAIVDRFQHDVKTNVIQALNSLDLLARNTLLGAYLSGAAAVNSGGPYSLTTTPTASVFVDDIRGLSTVIVNGVITPVSVSNPLLATVYPAGATAGSYQVSISLGTADATDVTDLVFVGTGGATSGARGNGVSGFLSVATVSGSKTLSVGDIIQANDAPAQFMPNGKLHWSKLTAADLLTQDNVLDAVAYIRDQGVQPLKDGTYLMCCSNRSVRNLYSDQNFQQAWRGLAQSEEYRMGKIDEYLGVTLLRTTNAPRVSLGAGLGFVHVPIIVGQGAVIDGVYAGMDDWASNQFQRGYVAMSKGLAQIIVPPIDRNNRQLKLSWLTIRDMVCPTDVTANSNIIQTGSSSRLKRAVAIPHGSSS